MAVADKLRVVGARVVDLRSEFKAQLRSIARLEEQLSRSQIDRSERSARDLEDVLRRCLADMLTNNANIRSVLKDLAKDIRVDSTAAPS